MIELRQVSKHYGKTVAVNNISFKVDEQETLVLLGTSGCGKTTTLKIINRLIDADSGMITIGDKDISRERPEILRRGIGYVMQHIGLFPHYTIAENISVGLKLLKWNPKKIEERIRELINQLHLPADCLKLFPHEMSGGQQQRIGLARALAADPPVLLMDEPFGALDNVTKSSIHAEFKVLEELRRKTIVMVTHDVQEAFELADRICLMDKGEIVQIGSPHDLLYRPANDFAKKFLDTHRLALEFKVVLLKDIWKLLPERAYFSENKEISAETSIWAAIEQLRLSGKEALNVLSQKSGERKTISFQDLTTGFNHYQRHGS